MVAAKKTDCNSFLFFLDGPGGLDVVEPTHREIAPFRRTSPISGVEDCHVSAMLTCHNRLAAVSSQDNGDDGRARSFAKYRPRTLATSGEEAR
jgi:hypothetical protein